MNRFCLDDGVALMRTLPAGSVDFICTDPPYRTTNLSFDKGKSIDWAEWWKEANRILKPAGVVCIFAAGTFLFEMWEANKKAYRYKLVWEKTRYSRFLDANHRPLESHEDILVFCRQPKKATYNPQKIFTENRPRLCKATPKDRAGHYSGVGPNAYNDTGFRHPGTVLKFASGNNRDFINPTQKPLGLIRWLVRSYSNPGDVVLDTCAGGATTAIACLEEERNYICVENVPEQYAKSEKRIATWHHEKALANVEN